MEKVMTKIGFQYFTSQDYFITQQMNAWMPTLRQAGASELIFSAGFDYAVPEDVIQCAIDNDLKPSVHFTTELTSPQYLKEISYLFDMYAKWGVVHVILGNKPNIRGSWQSTGWHHENLVDQFLDRFIPLAAQAIKVGLKPVLPPLQPGGDFWDTAFMELALEGLKKRQLSELVNNLFLASYGYTYNKPLSWGMGGPDRWSISKPYSTPEGHEDQLGFHNFEWYQAISQKVGDKKLPVIILDAGFPASSDLSKYGKTVQEILSACENLGISDTTRQDMIKFDGSVAVCAFALDSLEKYQKGNLSPAIFEKIFQNPASHTKTISTAPKEEKLFHHYLLLPMHESGVSDVVLNKVRPFIKKHQPTIGFSIEEACMAEKVSIFPDPILFTSAEINHLRSAGCVVEILPESGIDIATSLQES